MECLRAAFLRRRAMMTDSGAAPLKDEPAVPSPIASVAIPSCIDVDYGRDAALMGGSHTTALVVSHQGAFIRADAPILLALPDYYFEVCVLCLLQRMFVVACCDFKLLLQVTVKSLPTEAPKIGLWAVPQSKAALSSCVSSRYEEYALLYL